MSEYCKNCFELAEKLAKKEQECEELKEKNKVLQKLVSELEYSVQVGIELDDRYFKALKEIELTIKNLEKDDILTFPDFTLQENATIIMNQCNQGYRDIFDIINKVKGRRKMKYTKQQEAYVKAGATLCVECKMGYYGDKSCGSGGMQKLPKNSPAGCFRGKKKEGFKNC